MKRTVIIVLAAALTVSGCALKFLPDSISGEQISKRWIQLDFGVCGVGYQSSSCVSGGAVAPAFPGLVAFRVPKETEMPYEFSSVSGTKITLTRNQAYSRELNELAPHGPNARWFGYQSVSQDQEQIIDTYFEVQMRVPRGYTREEFGVTPVVGFTGSSAEVDCGPDVFARFGSAGTLCISDPTSKEGLAKVKIPLTLED